MRILPEVVGSGVCSSSGIRALKPFPELLLQAVERLLELWLVVRCPATRRDVILSRATTDPKFSGNLLGTSPQLVEPEHRARIKHPLDDVARGQFLVSLVSPDNTAGRKTEMENAKNAEVS